jgi:hypothetical protein
MPISFAHRSSRRMPGNSDSRPPTSHQPLPPRPIGSYLVEAGLITPAQVDVALNDQKFMDGMRFGDVLIARGWVKQQTLDFIVNRVIVPEQQQERRKMNLSAQNRLPTPQAEALPPETPETPKLEASNRQSRLPMIRLEMVPNQPYRSARLVEPNSEPDRSSLDDRPTIEPQPPKDDGVNWVG